VTIVEGLSFGYVIQRLPPGRLPYPRWRFELWHGDRMEAAGWRLTERDALRALRAHGSRVGHRLFGLRPPDAAPRGGGAPSFRPGAQVRVQDGAVSFSLVPRHLEAPVRRVAAPH
jgi:hypothetical protein